MTLPIIFRPEAGQDMAEVREWDEQQSIGLGREFLDAVDDALDRIRQFPESYAEE